MIGVRQIPVFAIFSLFATGCNASTATTVQSQPESVITNIGLSGYRQEYDSTDHQEVISYDGAESFTFQRFQSPKSIRRAFSKVAKPFKQHESKDGRHGHVSATKLGGDWVLAQSHQVASQCTAQEVLKAYLTGALQEKWNPKDVLKCTFTRQDDDINSMLHSNNEAGSGISKSKSSSKSNNNINPPQHYRQDLVLKSQRIITSKTGIMKYSQVITIDQVGNDNYSILVRLKEEDDDVKISPTTGSIQTTRPFDSLSVHVGLEQDGNDVNIYANGVMKVNRKVVPNLIVFDASGIASSMAGKGTLWLAAYFDERKRERKGGARASVIRNIPMQERGRTKQPGVLGGLRSFGRMRLPKFPLKFRL